MMTPDEFVRIMEEISKLDSEKAHIQADQALCDLLCELGYERGIEIYDSLDKWYA